MKHYTATVETSRRGNLPADEVDAAMDALASYAPSLSVSPHGYRSARITFPADSFTQAATTAVAVVSSALGGEPVALQVMTEAEADLRSGSLEVPDLVGATEAARILNVSPQRVRQMIDEGKLAAHRVGERAFALVRSQVEEIARTFVPRGMEWTTHPGLLGLLAEMDLPMDRVLPSPKIGVSIEHDGPHRARSVARYRFTVLGRYAGGKVIPVADSEQDLTEFDITRRSGWTTPE